MWKCGVCNYIIEGSTPPDQCPKCGAPREKFAELSEEEVALIQRSRYGNDLLMELNGLLTALAEMAESGIEDNLDPGCVRLWQECLEFSFFARQSLKAEIRNHLHKGKWG